MAMGAPAGRMIAAGRSASGASDRNFGIAAPFGDARGLQRVMEVEASPYCTVTCVLMVCSSVTAS